MAAVPDPVLLINENHLQSSEFGHNTFTCQAAQESLAALPGGFQAVRPAFGILGMTLLFSVVQATS